MRWYQRFFRRELTEKQLDAELRFHLDQKIADLVATGITLEEARRRAQLEFGGLDQRKEECRDVGGSRIIESLVQDLRYGARMFARNPGVSSIVLLSLALGIEANTAIFSLLNVVVLKALPVAHSEELVQFSETYPDGGENSNMSWPYFERIHDRNKSLSGVFAFVGLGRINVGFEGQAGLAEGQIATGEFYSTLALTPAIGRFFTDDDDRARRPVAVLSYAFWQRRFGRDPSVVGKTITLNQVPFTIIGVTPAPFFGLQVGDSPDVTVPMMMLGQLQPGPPDWDGPFDSWLQFMGRLKPGVTRQQAQAEFDVIYRQIITDLKPKAAPDQKAMVEQMLRKGRLKLTSGAKGYEWGLRHDFSLPLQILMMMVAIVLLIVSANVANLLLARATVRQREIAVRLAIGGSRGRLIRQLLTEGILLAGIGGVLGFLVAWWGSQVLLRMVSTGDSPLPVNLTPDFRIFAFTAGVSLVTGVLFGLAPAIRGTRVDLTPALKEGRGQTGAEGRRRAFALDKVLVAAQIALSLTLLVGAGLFMRSLQKLWAINPGYDRNNVLMFSLDPRLAGFRDTPKLVSLYRQLLGDLEVLPGVRSASLSLVRPVDDAAYWVNVVESIDGRKLPEGRGIRVAVNDLGPGYFATLGTPMLLGREFSPGDNENSAKVAIVSETLARQCFGSENPIGRRIADHDDGEFQIVGVVKDSRYGSVRDLPRGVLYMPLFQANLAEAFFATTFEVRYSGTLPPILDEVRRQVQAVDPNLALFRVKTLEVQTRDSFVKERLIATLSTFFGLLAVLLACVGLYGTMAYGVARRTGEIGVRVALGASQGDVLWLVLREILLLILFGLAVGLPCALGASRLLASQLYGVKATDTLTLAAGSLLLAGVALLAGYMPARRASRVDPMVALRYE